MKEESWCKTGQRTFVNNCAGCHAMSRESSGDQRQVLGLEYFERNGGIDEARIQNAIRYGKGKMPGYAADCGDENDNFAAMCSTVIPLSEEKLRDTQDFFLNRVNADWKGSIDTEQKGSINW
ncbi:unnamed protein product [Polarella glacialis]|uniref:Cytochrome c domain-containing protein n=1 Tax=Polarella glacialis TaxID=89957 RepID=A0A813H204_POLGL|nr:unnamed protein product [Polarella glacialis]CAE8712163.1 unnamed protein product [Polarella glacialis]